MVSRQSLGAWGEAVAAGYLSERGYLILERNFRTPYGEVDLVVQKDEQIIFVEVKTRTSDAFGLPEQAITPRKQGHLIDSAQAYLQLHPELKCDWRVDVIAIRKLPGDRPPEILHFENAVN